MMHVYYTRALLEDDDVFMRKGNNSRTAESLITMSHERKQIEPCS